MLLLKVMARRFKFNRQSGEKDTPPVTSELLAREPLDNADDLIRTPVQGRQPNIEDKPSMQISMDGNLIRNGPKTKAEYQTSSQSIKPEPKNTSQDERLARNIIPVTVSVGSHGNNEQIQKTADSKRFNLNLKVDTQERLDTYMSPTASLLPAARHQMPTNQVATIESDRQLLTASKLQSSSPQPLMSKYSIQVDHEKLTERSSKQHASHQEPSSKPKETMFESTSQASANLTASNIQKSNVSHLDYSQGQFESNSSDLKSGFADSAGTRTARMLEKEYVTRQYNPPHRTDTINSFSSSQFQPQDLKSFLASPRLSKNSSLQKQGQVNDQDKTPLQLHKVSLQGAQTTRTTSHHEDQFLSQVSPQVTTRGLLQPTISSVKSGGINIYSPQNLLSPDAESYKSPSRNLHLDNETPEYKNSTFGMGTKANIEDQLIIKPRVPIRRANKNFQLFS